MLLNVRYYKYDFVKSSRESTLLWHSTSVGQKSGALIKMTFEITNFDLTTLITSQMNFPLRTYLKIKGFSLAFDVYKRGWVEGIRGCSGLSSLHKRRDSCRSFICPSLFGSHFSLRNLPHPRVLLPRDGTDTGVRQVPGFCLLCASHKPFPMLWGDLDSDLVEMRPERSFHTALQVWTLEPSCTIS